MTATLNLNIQGNSGMSSAIKVLQAYLSRPVSPGIIDNQSLAAEIIKLQTYLSTVVAGGQPSGFKFDPLKICKSIDDQQLAARLMTLQVAADLT